VPTFNRGRPLEGTLKYLLANKPDGFDALEIIVVDDGSFVPAREVVEPRALDILEHQSLLWLRQKNAGPARARNTGFRKASGEIVLFLDDDILAPPDLVKAHVSVHRSRPGAVVFGFCPFAPGRKTFFRTFLERESDCTEQTTAPEVLVPARIVASGQISFQRGLFASSEDVYSSDLVTPAAEEYELTFRLRKRGVPILTAPRIVAWHDQPVDLETYCRAQYKHGLGCGEAVAKKPYLLGLDELSSIIEATGAARADFRRRHAPRRALKWVISRKPVSSAILRVASTFDNVPMPTVLRHAAYRTAISSHFIAGVRDGVSLFGRRG